MPEGGALICLEHVIDDDRRKDPFPMLMSLNMLIETPAGSNYSGADFASWAKQVGFKDTRVLPLAGPTSAAIAYK